MSMLKLCKCGLMIPLDQKNCKDCERKRHKIYDTFSRDKQVAAFYNSKEWKTIRKRVLNECNHLCESCLRYERIRVATMVDHIVPIKIEWAKRLSRDNLQGLCAKCHADKTAKDKRMYGG